MKEGTVDLMARYKYERDSIQAEQDRIDLEGDNPTYDYYRSLRSWFSQYIPGRQGNITDITQF